MGGRGRGQRQSSEEEEEEEGEGGCCHSVGMIEVWNQRGLGQVCVKSWERGAGGGVRWGGWEVGGKWWRVSWLRKTSRPRSRLLEFIDEKLYKPVPCSSEVPASRRDRVSRDIPVRVDHH